MIMVILLNSLINEVPWISVLSGDIDEMYQSFVELLVLSVVNAFPILL